MNKLVIYILCFFIGIFIAQMTGEGFSIGGQKIEYDKKLCEPFDNRSELAIIGRKCSDNNNKICSQSNRAININCGQYCGCRINPPNKNTIVALYKQMSWHNENNKTKKCCITKVRDQGHDGRCNIHALMAAIETYIYINNLIPLYFNADIPYEKRPEWNSKETNHLSVQYLIQYGHSLIAGSSKSPGGNSLWLSEFLKIEKPLNDYYKIYSKIFLEKDMRYVYTPISKDDKTLIYKDDKSLITEKKSLNRDITSITANPQPFKLIGCGYFKKDNSLKITDIHKIFKNHLKKYGPIVMAVDSNYLQKWRHDTNKKFEGELIYNISNTLDIHHAVCLIGYGNNEYGEYWIIKNSHGKNGGIMKIHINAINQSIKTSHMKTDIYENFSFPIIESNGRIYPEIFPNDKKHVINYIEWSTKMSMKLKKVYCKQHELQCKILQK